MDESALVYHGPGNKAWEEVPNPELREPTDAIVRAAETKSMKVAISR